MRRIHRWRGFSVIETLMVSALTGILLSIAAPSFRKAILDTHRAAVVNDLVSSIQFARSESYKRSGYVTLCPSADGATCLTSRPDWEKGWIVYANLDREYSGVEPDAGEPVLRYVATEAGITVSTGGRRALTFRPFQLNSDNGTITVCDERGASSPAERRGIVVNTVGRPRLTDRKADGSPLDCR